MSMGDRVRWVQDFQNSHDTGGWLNAIQGVVTAADVNGLTNKSWFGKRRCQDPCEYPSRLHPGIWWSRE
jgi:hypothetical protein